MHNSIKPLNIEQINAGTLMKISKKSEYPLRLETKFHESGYKTTILTDEEAGASYIVVDSGKSIAITPRYTNRGQD